MTLTEFLTARLDEEEHQARLTIENRTGPPARALLGPIDVFGHMEVQPEHVLADVAAKRAIVEEYVEADAYYRVRADAPAGELTGLRTAVLLLAQPYADHPDFDPAWRMK